MLQTNHILRQRVALLRWIIPAALVLITILYEFGPARWLQDNLHDPVDLEIFLYGVLSPLLAFWVLTYIGNWLAKTERAEQQARTSDRRLASIMSASADAILVLADPIGPTCHKGTESCFADAASTDAQRLAFLALLENIIANRIADQPDGDANDAWLRQMGWERAEAVGRTL